MRSTARNIFGHACTGCTMKPEILTELLELAATEERFYVDAHQKRIQFFVVLNSTLFAGCVLGLTRGSTVDVGPLMMAPLLILFASQFGKIGVKSLYVRLLETIVVRAKLEQALGFGDPMSGLKEAGYWLDEPLINTRHLISRKRYPTSQGFIIQNSERGYQKTVVRIFSLFQFVAVLLGAVIAYLSPAVSNFAMEFFSLM